MNLDDGDFEVINEVGVIVVNWVSRDTDHVESFEFNDLQAVKDLRDMLDIAIWEYERMSG